jgi:hypothetical protein
MAGLSSSLSITIQAIMPYCSEKNLHITLFWRELQKVPRMDSQYLDNFLAQLFLASARNVHRKEWGMYCNELTLRNNAVIR